MSTKGGEGSGEPRWYVKFFEYLKNRNRIGPATVELADCDFLIVAPRRTLRVLKPSLKGEWYYENTSERPESINDNFFARWSRRPHSSNHCRCSYRRSSRLSTNDEEIISTELNRIRNSLCETPEKSPRDIEELEQRVSANLQRLQIAIPDVNLDNNNETKTRDELVLHDRTKNLSSSRPTNEEQRAAKRKIVEDLERYINVLLEEILDDTIKRVANSNDANSILKNDRDVTDDRSPISEAKGDDCVFNEISFSFHNDEKKIRNDENFNGEGTTRRNDRGYINRAFIGSANDPDSLDFYLRTRTLVGTEVTLEQFDCIDSGINSVETIEFQPDQEPSLEQSLLRIIDEKLGRTPLRNSWEDLRANGDEKLNENSSSSSSSSSRDQIVANEDVGEEEENNLTRLKDVVVLNDNEINEERNVVDIRQLEESIDDPKFENVRLELDNDDLVESTIRKETTIGMKLCSRFRTNVERGSRRKKDVEKLETINLRKDIPTLEMEDYRKRWPNFEESTRLSNCEQNPNDYVIFRRNRKPTLVFLHGFGSSAEIFEHQLEYFSAMGYPCIAPDLLGHGMSSSPDRSKDYAFGRLLKDLETVLHYYAFKPGQKCILIAHNYG